MATAQKGYEKKNKLRDYVHNCWGTLAKFFWFGSDEINFKDGESWTKHVCRSCVVIMKLYANSLCLVGLLTWITSDHYSVRSWMPGCFIMLGGFWLCCASTMMKECLQGGGKNKFILRLQYALSICLLCFLVSPMGPMGFVGPQWVQWVQWVHRMNPL